MRWLDVRRHSLTKKGAARGRGSHLSADGIALARFIGSGVGPYERVVTSSSPRAVETAVAMGFAVDDTMEMPSGYVPGEIPRHAQWGWTEPYRRLAEIIQEGRAAATVAENHRAIWADTVSAVAEGCSALLVGHGGQSSWRWRRASRMPHTIPGGCRSRTATVRASASPTGGS
ncbi:MULTISPECIES: hypothetical protein [unclassified Nonomuraea]|uniref:hypothetical protein n=1 Tax=unclassified Nonomuraea TaxID=2593643 RepID=UPI0034020089